MDSLSAEMTSLFLNENYENDENDCFRYNVNKTWNSENITNLLLTFPPSQKAIFHIFMFFFFQIF